jgi:catechol 2,3-dioxygenase
LQGASDHLVSEAIYLADPEGNGIEIYRDRPREAWYKNGQMQMATLPMDAEGVLSEAADGAAWDGLPAGTRMGHIHLHVANVQQAAAYYQQTLGMDLMFDVGSAAFLSYDGYHHHVGINIWGVRGLAPDDALGLKDFDLHVSAETHAQIIDAAGASTLQDTAGNRIQLRR